MGYKKGVYTDSACNRSPNHAVAVVGYGSLERKKTCAIFLDTLTTLQSNVETATTANPQTLMMIATTVMMEMMVTIVMMEMMATTDGSFARRKFLLLENASKS